jgi:hypothetical protein
LKFCRTEVCLALLLAVAVVGCRREAASSDERTPPNPSAPALYGPSTGAAAREIPRTLPSGTNDSDWQSASFYILQTELSPATLVHSSGKKLDLFAGMTNHGLGAPMFVAWATINGPRTFKRGESFAVTNMAEGWVLVWWAGAEGWTNWDSPWVVYLQHQPNMMKLDADGLHLEFPSVAGDVALLPLYGYDKPPQGGRDFRTEHGLPQPKMKIKTWEWPKVITRDPLTRIRYWASATREFPIHCEDSFSVNRARDSVTIRSRFLWRSIDDDWKTRHIKLAPLSPPLAHAAKLGGFPAEFSRRWFDLEMPTPCGPYMAIEGVDEFDATLSVVQYVNETEAFEAPMAAGHPNVQLALDKLHAVAARTFQPPGTTGGGNEGASGLSRLIEGAGWFAKGLPYYEEATRSNALFALRKSFREGAAQSDVNGIEALWAYAHFTGDWELVKDRWPMVKKRFVAPARSRWASFGSEGIAAIGDEVAPCAAFARLAYQAGDLDAYNYGCYVFARQLTLLFLKDRGADYFRQHQPWHSMEFMDEEVFLTRLDTGNLGWRFDGPKYPAGAGERLFENRWARFNDWDVARFHREYLKEDVRREINWLQRRGAPERRWHNDPREMPSLVQLRSLLLNETPAELAAVARPDQFAGPPAGEIASCLSMLRTSHPTRYQRLIPPGDPSPFVTGLEREVSGPNTDLIASIEYQAFDSNTKSSLATWPQLTWPQWKTPSGAHWSFGHIRPVREAGPRAARVVPLNWNTRAIVFDLP